MQVDKVQLDNNLVEILKHFIVDFTLLIYTDNFCLFYEYYIRWYWHKDSKFY
ncbi:MULTISPECIES: hypothetical protein [unclassified Romboutsia]|uniref:hypothetical protein n=1 Tax=unclassified Romboutsia TaxID=2626894 RepID=UPI000821CA19|nr:MULTISPECIES: hypothetical protein [unclassified Romboutsia]SCI40961.1 Uncharacterised protein [uncultured Clostridium sp.]